MKRMSALRAFRNLPPTRLGVWLLLATAVPVPLWAAETPAAYASVEDNLRTMDKDGDGVVTVYEVRAYIEAKHGKDYQKTLLDDMESSAQGKSCSTPFAQSLY